MKCNFSVCCFKLKFFLTFWSEFITFHRDNCFAQCVTIVGSQPNFFSIALKSCLHPLLYYDKPLSHCANGHSSYFCDHYNSISIEVFTTASVRTLLSLIRLSPPLVDTWSLVYHLIANVVSDLCSWAFLIAHLDIFHCWTFGHKSYLVLFWYYENYNGFGHLVFILALDFHPIIIWRNFDYMVLRLWNTNICNMHRMHWQVYKVW